MKITSMLGTTKVCLFVWYKNTRVNQIKQKQVHGKTQKKDKTRKSKRLKGPESGSMKRKNRMKINREAEQRKKTNKRTHSERERKKDL